MFISKCDFCFRTPLRVILFIRSTLFIISRRDFQNYKLLVETVRDDMLLFVYCVNIDVLEPGLSRSVSLSIWIISLIILGGVYISVR